MKLIIIGDKENNQIKAIRPSNYNSYNSNFENYVYKRGQAKHFYKISGTYKSKKKQHFHCQVLME